MTTTDEYGKGRTNVMKRSATYPYYQAFGLEKDQKADDGLKVDGADNAVLLRIMPRPAKKSTERSVVVSKNSLFRILT